MKFRNCTPLTLKTGNNSKVTLLWQETSPDYCDCAIWAGALHLVAVYNNDDLQIMQPAFLFTKESDNLTTITMLPQMEVRALDDADRALFQNEVSRVLLIKNLTPYFIVFNGLFLRPYSEVEGMWYSLTAHILEGWNPKLCCVGNKEQTVIQIEMLSKIKVKKTKVKPEFDESNSFVQDHLETESPLKKMAHDNDSLEAETDKPKNKLKFRCF